MRILLGIDPGGVAPGARATRADLRGVQEEANRTQQTLSQIGKGIAAGFGIGAGLGAFNLASRGVRELTDFLGDSARAAANEQAGIERLNASLLANVAGYDGNREAIERTIAAREALAFADDAQRDSLARALAATHDITKAQELLAGAMDLARFKQISLQDATQALISVEAGRFRALAQLGIVLRDGATQEEALAAVRAVAAGQAEAFAKTAQGQAQALDVALQDLSEEIGTALLPAVRDFTGAVRDMIPVVKDGAGVVGEFLNLINQFGNPFAGANAALEAHAKALEEAYGISRLAGEGTREYLARVEPMLPLLEGATGGLHELNEGLSFQRGFLLQATTAQNELNTSLGRSSLQMLTTGAQARHLADDLRVAAAGANALGDEMLRIIQYGSQFGGGAGTAGTIIPGGSTAGVGATGDITDVLSANAAAARNKAASDAATAHAKALRDQAEADRKYAADMRDRLTDAYDAVDDAARRYYSDVHNQRLKDIDEERAAANAKIDEQERAIRGFVDQQRALVDAQRSHRRETELRTDIVNALTPEERARAQQALDDFLEDQRLAFLSADADQRIAKLDADKATNDELAAQAKDAEDQRYADQVRAFEDQEKLLKKHIDAEIKDYKRLFDEIARLAKSAGVSDLVGIYPNPGKSAAAASSAGRDVQRQVSDATFNAGGGKLGDVYLDGEKVGEFLDRRSGRLEVLYRPAGASTGSQR